MTVRGLILLAAGGSGGHVFPARALCAAMRDRGWDVGFITDERGLTFAESDETLKVHQIKAASLGGGACGKLKGLALLGVGLLQACALLRRLRPDAVVGFGGYPSVPTMVAATLCGFPTLIHEQNAVLGRANRLVAPRVDRIATVYEEVAGVKPEDRTKIVLTGNPARAEMAEAATRNPAATPTILVLGGSQGARILSDVVPAAVASLPESLRKNLTINQQCRPEDIERVRTVYDESGMTPRLETFFDDIPQLMADAHLVISRAGASTIAELTVAGRPAILVPYAHAMDDHQTANARNIAEKGGAWMIPQADFTADALADRLAVCLSSPSLLAEAGRKAAACGYPDAADRLADAVEELAAPVREAAA